MSKSSPSSAKLVGDPELVEMFDGEDLMPSKEPVVPSAMPVKGIAGISSKLALIAVGIVGVVVVVAVVVAVVLVTRKGDSNTSNDPVDHSTHRGSAGDEGEVNTTDPPLSVAPRPPGSLEIVIDPTTGVVTGGSPLRLPFQASRFISNADSSKGMLRGRDTITVVFNRAVLALGSNFVEYDDAKSVQVGGVDPLQWTCTAAESTTKTASPPIPGRMRWVTTTILRFDPSEDWPTDVLCEVTVNPALKTYDGFELVGGSPTFTFTTPQLAFNTQGVTSELAMRYTDGMWQSRLPLDDLHECPSDGELAMWFGSNVALDAVKKALQVTPSVEFDVKYSSYCKGEPCTSLVLTFPGGLADATKYKLTFPVGSRLTPHGGPTRSELTGQVSGLFPFTFPFSRYLNLRHTNQRLMVRHGLPEDVDMDALKAAITVSPIPAGGFEVTLISKSEINIHAAFLPDTAYTIGSVAAPAVKDSFGQPLQASTAEVPAANLYPFVSIPNHHTLLRTNGDNEPYIVLARGATEAAKGSCRGQTVSIRNVPVQDIGKALGLAHYCDAKDYFKSAPTRGPQLASLDVEEWKFDKNTMFGQSGVALQAVQRQVRGPWEPSCQIGRSRPQCTLLTRSSVVVVGSSTPGRVVAWATTADSGAPATGAQATLYKRVSRAYTLLDTKTVDADGVVEFNVPLEYASMIVVINQGGSLSVSSDIQGRSANNLGGTVVLGDLVTERGLYRTGEVMHLKGFVRTLERTGSHSVALTERSVRVVAQWGSESKEYTTVLTDLGTFTVDVPIPDDASYGNHYLNARVLTLPGDQYRTWSGSHSFLIADPRVPTGVLKASLVEKLVRPADPSVTIVLETLTYTGTAAKGTEVDLRWSLGDQKGEFTVNLPEGRLNHTFTLTPAALKDVSPYADLSITAEWFAAGRERLVESLSVPVRKSAWSFELQCDDVHSLALPGYPYECRAMVTTPKPTDVSVSSPPIIRVGGTRYEVRPEGSEAPTFPTTSDITVGAIRWTEADHAGMSSSGMYGPSVTLVGTFVIKMPQVGAYQLMGEVTDSNSEVLEKSMWMGMTMKEWKARPLTSMQHTLQVEWDAAEYEVPSRGGTTRVGLRWDSPYVQAEALVQWASGQSTSPVVHRSLHTVKKGANVFSFDVTDECADGSCGVNVIVLAPRQPPSSVQLAVPVPMSPVLDLSMPEALVAQAPSLPMSRKSVPRKLALQVTPYAPVVRPGDQTNLTVVVKDSNTGLSRGTRTEVAVWIVDKALLDLHPHPLPSDFNINDKYYIQQPYMAASLNSVHMLATPDQLSTPAATIVRRLGVDPWVSVGLYPTHPGDPSFDRSDETFFQCTFNDLTYFGNSWKRNQECRGRNTWSRGGGGGGVEFMGGAGEEAMADAAPLPTSSRAAPAPSPPGPPPASKGAGNGDMESGAVGAASSVAGLIRSDFQATPLFVGSVETDAGGKVQIPFTVPDNIGTWVVRAVAIDESGYIGTGEGEMVSKREVSLQASMPRVVRVGDRFQGGCTVTLGTTSSVRITAIVDPPKDGAITLIPSIQLVGPASKDITVQADTPIEVVFDFRANGYGPANFLFTASWVSSAPTVEDAFQHELGSLGMQDPVFIGTSFAVPAQQGSSPDWGEGVDFPAAVTGTGSLTVVAGVGHLPTVQNIGTGLTEEFKTGLERPKWLHAETILGAVVPPAAYRRYSTGKLEGVDEANVAWDLLVRYTRGSDGLQPYQSMSFPYRSIALNAWATYLWGVCGSVTPSKADAVNNVLDDWKQAIDLELLERYQTWVDASRKYDIGWWNELAWARWALGKDWKPTSKGWNAEAVQMSGIARLVSRIDKLADAEAAIVVLTVTDTQGHQSGAPGVYSGVVSRMATRFIGKLRVQGRTAYVSRGSGSAHAAPMVTNALVLEALLRTPSSNDPLVEKLSQHVAGSGDSGPRTYHRFFKQGGVLASLALSTYDASRGSTDPDLTLTVKASGRTSPLLSQKYDKSNPTFIAEETYSWAELGDSKEVTFASVGTKGEASVVLGMKFIPAEVFENPVYFGLYVQKVVAVVDTLKKTTTVYTNESPELIPGQLVRVTIQVATPDDLYNGIMVVDPVPGCLEAIDTNVGGQQSSGSSWGQPTPYRSWMRFAPPERWGFPTQEVRKEEVRCYTSFLTAGTHTCTYDAVVVTSGSFHLPPTKAYSVPQPELMGLSNTHPITVAPRE